MTGRDGVDVFVLGQVQGLDEGFGRDRRGSRARKKIYHRGHGDRSTERTESYCAALQSAAVAAGGKGEGTQRGTVLGAIGGHMEVLQKRKIRFGIFWGASRRRGALLNRNNLPERLLSCQYNFGRSVIRPGGLEIGRCCRSTSRAIHSAPAVVQGMPIFCLYAWYTPPG